VTVSIDDMVSLGKMMMSSGLVEEGVWVQGAISQGKRCMGRVQWEGSFVNGLLHGHGTQTRAESRGDDELGSVFVGEWRTGSKVRGRETFSDGASFEGEFEGQLPIKGVMLTPCHAAGIVRQEGSFADGELHGDGCKMTFHDGSSWEGAWSSGKRHGRGRLTAADSRVTEVSVCSVLV
jgi:hypothetical protein